jgi:Ni/Fe-hydrogenase subunit HybB-like protein
MPPGHAGAVASDVVPRQPFASINEQISAITLHPPYRRNWWIGILMSGALVGLLVVSIGWLLLRGVGIWNLNIPVNWGLAIINYVWWIAIGSAGTLISALLLLLGAVWRNSLNRFAEAMTVFAVICAAIFPIIHLGRPFFFLWLFPYPNVLGAWPQFRSPLEWDVFAVPIYLLVSILFWYIGLVPDLASVRDRATARSAQVFYGLLSLGWRGSAVHWARWQRVYRLIAILGVPLVVSVHSGVALLYAVGQLPGWHSTIFPPFFVIGAIFNGFAVVAMIAIVLRHAFGLGNLVTGRHLDILAMVLLATGIAVGYCYLMEAFTAWYSGDLYERQTLYDRAAGIYAFSYWGAILCNVVATQVLWWPKARRNALVLFAVSSVVTIGMWLERFMLQTTALYKDFLPSAYGFYLPSFWEYSTLLGSIGLFFFLFLLFVRFLPMISIFEVEEVIADERREKAT